MQPHTNLRLHISTYRVVSALIVVAVHVHVHAPRLSPQALRGQPVVAAWKFTNNSEGQLVSQLVLRFKSVTGVFQYLHFTELQLTQVPRFLVPHEPQNSMHHVNSTGTRKFIESQACAWCTTQSCMFWSQQLRSSITRGHWRIQNKIIKWNN